MFVATLKGPGRVMFQALPFSRLVDFVGAFSVRFRVFDHDTGMCWSGDRLKSKGFLTRSSESSRSDSSST